MESLQTAPLSTSPAVCLSSKSTPPPPTLDTGQQAAYNRVGSPGSEDAETFTGKIVYNPDGSAYIIEGSDGSDVESEVGAMLPLNQEGSIVDRAGPGSSGTSSCSPPISDAASASASAIPQVVSAFHIQRSSTATLQSIYSAMYGQNAALANQLLQEKVPEVPIMHSYRVFTLRDKDGASATSRRSVSSYSGEGDANNNLDQSGDEGVEAGPGHTVPVKPILMCFICKISFGYAKSFVSHATSEHRLTLIDEERRLLSRKNTSAIIQGVGKDKEPLLSFLEPKNKAPQPLLPQSLAGLAANLNQLSAVVSSTASGGFSSSLHQQFQQQLEAAQQRLMQAAAAAAIRGNTQSSVSSSSATAGGDGQRESPSRPSSNG